jgi:hypothetical protein
MEDAHRIIQIPILHWPADTNADGYGDNHCYGNRYCNSYTHQNANTDCHTIRPLNEPFLSPNDSQVNDSERGSPNLPSVA